MHSNRYTIVFSLLVCVTCSVILALTAGGLKPMIRKNEEFDVHRNILKALNLPEDGNETTVDDLETLYTDRIREIRVNEAGKVMNELPPDSDGEPVTALPVFVRMDGNTATGYCIPVSGKGLWSTIYGYLAIQADGETVMGITFYRHGETPGLGGEVESAWFTRNFIGKKIFDDKGVLRSITIAKGPVSDDVPQENRRYMVDGISGATMTGKGVDVFLRRDLERYESFLRSIQRGESPVVGGV